MEIDQSPLTMSGLCVEQRSSSTLDDMASSPHRAPHNAQKVFQGTVFTVWQWEQKLYDGSLATFEMMTRPDTAYLLPVLPDGSLLLIQDEQPHRPPVLTIPRGRVEEGEHPHDAARRELLEETGYEVTELVDWHHYSPWGKVAWTIYFYIGRGATFKATPTAQAGERITLKPTSFEQFVELATQGALQDPQIQIMMLQAKLDPTKMAAFKKNLYG